VAFLTLNKIVFLRDRAPGCEFDAAGIPIKATAQDIDRRRRDRLKIRRGLSTA
jgi:hypothetical protein